MKASELFTRALEAEGVEYLFGIPGEENLDLLDSLSRSSIKLVLTRHEQAAGFMAATYGRLTGRVGVCMSTLGPGATNFVTAAAYAQLGGMPMMMITGQKPVRSSKQGQFQIVDVVDMMRPLTKYTRQIVSSENGIPSRIREAFRLADGGRTTGSRAFGTARGYRGRGGQTNETAVPSQLCPSPHVPKKRRFRRAIEIDPERNDHPLLVLGAGANRKITDPAHAASV